MRLVGARSSRVVGLGEESVVAAATGEAATTGYGINISIRTSKNKLGDFGGYTFPIITRALGDTKLISAPHPNQRIPCLDEILIHKFRHTAIS